MESYHSDDLLQADKIVKMAEDTGNKSNADKVARGIDCCEERQTQGKQHEIERKLDHGQRIIAEELTHHEMVKYNFLLKKDYYNDFLFTNLFEWSNYEPVGKPEAYRHK